MKERPILFKPEMIIAILNNSKTMTRRVVKSLKCPYVKISDKFWVKETWSTYPPYSERPTIICNTDSPHIAHKKTGLFESVIHKAGKENFSFGMYGEPKWKSPLLMPKTATRIWLEITYIRIERLQDITVYDCLAEGIEINPDNLFSPVTKLSIDTSFLILNKFEILWDSINKKEPYRWQDNPFTFVIEFRKLR